MPEKAESYNPLVSVVIPCYNGQKYLPEALDSVLNQSYANWECIVADDGSTDNSMEIVQGYMKKDTRFKYVQQVNAGPSAARNLGIKIAKGDFFQFLDSDDLLESKKLERQIQVFFENPLADLVYGDMKYFIRKEDRQIELRADDDTHWKKGMVSGAGDAVISVLLQGNIMVVDSPLIRKSVFEKVGLWDTDIWFNEDWDVWTRCALEGLTFQFDNTPGTSVLVRYHEESRSRDVYKMYLHGLKVCLKINRVVKSWKYRKIIRPKIYNHEYFLYKDILAKYKTDKSKSLEMASTLSHETNKFHYQLFKWFMYNMPYDFCLIYFKWNTLFNRLKYKTVYES